MFVKKGISKDFSHVYEALYTVQEDDDIELRIIIQANLDEEEASKA